jgi:hypothetical protein
MMSLQPLTLSPTSTESVLLEVLAERQRQIEVHGWTPEHDDLHGLEDFGWLCARRAVEMSHAGAAGAVDCRRLFVEISTIAVAAIEAIDRREVRANGTTNDQP